MATDDFNRANSGSLGADWTALAGTWTINSNAAEVADDDGPTGYYARRDAEGDLGSADHWSEVVPVGTQTDGASNCGPAVRHRAGATTGYQFVTKFSDSCEFWRIAAGTEQGPLATFTAAVNSGDTCRLEAVGRTFRFKVNGTIVNVLQDTNIADGQRPAMNGYNGNSSDLVRVDAWAGGLMTTLTAPYVADWSAQVTGTGTTLTPTIPAQVAAGDLVLVQTTSRDAAQTMTAPGSEGWSSIQNPSQTGLEDVVWGKVWGLGGQSDDATPTFSIGSGTAGWGATAVIIRNPAHATAPWTSVSAAVVASGSQSNAAAATVTCPSVSHTGNNRTVVRIGSSADDNALNAPSQGFLWYGGAAYDQTTGNDYSQAMSVAEDITVTTNTSTSTFAESVLGNDVSNGVTLVLAIPSGTAVTGTAATTGTGSLATSGVRGVAGAASLASTGALNASGQRGTAGTSVLAGTGSLAVVGVRTTSGQAALSGAGTLTSAGLRGRPGLAVLTGTATLVASGDVAVTGAASLAGGNLTASGVRSTAGQASLSGGGLAASGTTGRSGTASLPGGGTFGSVGTRGVAGAALATGTGSLAASGEVSSPGEGLGSLAGVGTLGAAGVRAVAAVASLQGSGSLAGSGIKAVGGSASLAGAGTLIASGVVEGVVTGTGALIGGGLLAGAGSRGARGAAVLAASALLTVSGGRRVAGLGLLAGAGVLTAAAAESPPGTVRISSTARPTVASTLNARRLVDQEVTTS